MYDDLPNDEVLQAWKAFKDDYRRFKEEWDRKHPELGRVLNEFFSSDRRDKQDPADWWKRQ